MNPQEYDLMYRVEDDHWWYVGMRAISRAMLVDRVGDLPAPRILDAGCGTGRNLLELGRFGETTGIDLSPHAIELSAKRGLKRLARASVAQLPFAEGTFDIVTAFDVLCHGAVPDEVASLREFGRVLRPGGWLLLHLPAYAWLTSPHDRAVDNARRYAAVEVRGMLGAAGFAVERMTYANTVLFPLAALKRLADRALRAGRRTSDLETGFGWIGSVFRTILVLEARLVRHVDLPFGLTLVALARKEGSSRAVDDGRGRSPRAAAAR
jgi:SAM-dependent methyltransferase